ncbi:hypothetical protein GPECTOR_13g680 [Gonium pectorale]|uniref:Uncharacterized protein n=1 Tax=Gonium pectorale TaxID=33097 RepID=A0A150GMX6_GONPE|nr:hypothetical protein GPECTOR_13g680 [Gonium pectorale]|eukprot:KXZ51193.1 hypothetical protein GPECTOR_13g680 [Gonium pectorale]
MGSRHRPGALPRWLAALLLLICSTPVPSRALADPTADAALSILLGDRPLEPPANVLQLAGVKPADGSADSFLPAGDAWRSLLSPYPRAVLPNPNPTPTPRPTPSAARKLLSHPSSSSSSSSADGDSLQCGGLFPPRGCTAGGDCSRGTCPLAPVQAATLEDCLCAVNCAAAVLVSWCAAGYRGCLGTCLRQQPPNPWTRCPNSCTLQVSLF